MGLFGVWEWCSGAVRCGLGVGVGWVAGWLVVRVGGWAPGLSAGPGYPAPAQGLALRPRKMLGNLFGVFAYIFLVRGKQILKV